ncbi:unnamed protein product [Boreogadus saida]
MEIRSHSAYTGQDSEPCLTNPELAHRGSLLCFPPPGSATPPVSLTSHLALICNHAHLVFISNQLPFINPWIPCCRCQIVLRTTVLSGSLAPARLPRSPPGYLIHYLLPRLVQ